jgi:GTPase SAR1 family protein
VPEVAVPPAPPPPGAARSKAPNEVSRGEAELIGPRDYKRVAAKPKQKPRVALNTERPNAARIKLSEEQHNLFTQIENSSDHFFITGKAGTGKSVLLQYLKANSKKQLVVAAPTGVAALHVGGQTIHSLFGLPIGFVDASKLTLKPKVKLVLKHIDAVVIDEVSMVRADMMDGIDHLLRAARGSNQPFGGTQMILFGDPYQLPPVVKDDLVKYFAHVNGGAHFFNAHVWKMTSLAIYELTHIFRQDDEMFKEILNALRVGNPTDEHLEMLNSRAELELPFEGIVTLSTTNYGVSEINQMRLRQLPGKKSSTPAGQGQVALDIFEYEGYYIIKAPIAGVKISDIDIEVNDNVLTIRYEP